MYMIWVDTYDSNGKFTGSSVSVHKYTQKGNAIRAAKRKFGKQNEKYVWKIIKI